MTNIATAELANVELLAGFQPDELEQLATRMNSRDCVDGEIVFAAGDDSRSLYVVLNGLVQIELVGDVVDETVLAELGPQDVFGESTFFHAATHNATARCLEVTRLAELPRSAYESMLKECSSVAYHLGANAAHILAARLQATDQWIREVLDRDERTHRSELRRNYVNAFRPSFRTPGGFVGLGGIEL